MSVHNNYNVPAVERTLRIFEYLQRNPQAPFTRIYQDLDFPKTSAYGILCTLEQQGYVRKGSNGGYRLGFKLCELGNSAIEDVDFVHEAIPIMENLASLTGLTCNLGILEGDFGVYLEKIQPPSPIKLNSWRGKTIALHCTSLGKVLLAHKTINEIIEIIERIELTPKTIYTKTDTDSLLIELLQIKKDGYAADIEENEIDVTCFAAPIFDYSGKVIAAISISGLSIWLNTEKQKETIEHLKNGARLISEKIGWLAG